MPQGGRGRRRSGAQPGDPLLQNQPYSFSSQMATFGTNQINGGALFAGDSRPFPQNDTVNAISKPFVCTRIRFTLSRVAGGNEVDSDWEGVTAMVSGVSFDMKYMRNPVPLGALVDRQRREWLLQPGRLIFGKAGGGVNIEMSVQPGVPGAPFNFSVACHGYLQAFVAVDEQELPTDAAG